MLVGERSDDFRDQSFICLEIELWVSEEDVKPLLEVQHEILLHDLGLDVLGEDVVVFILSQEGIGAELEVLQRVVLPHVDHSAIDLLFRWNLSSDFDDEILDDLNHEVSVLASRDLLSNHETLHFFDGHGVEKHAHELEAEDDGRLDCVSLRCRDVTKATGRQRRRYEVNGDDVLRHCVKLVNALAAHPRL